MQWDNTTATEEIGKIEHLANMKYDGYRNFEPGRRFLESLTLWLGQFANPEERKTAYKFVMERMLYISEIQMDHLVGLLYPQRILPILLRQAHEATGIPPYKYNKIRTSSEFKEIQRRTLFLGMSDGARIDAFRRKNALHNDQVSVSYELNQEKWKRMHKALKEGTNKIEGHEPCFENVFLIDDFSGSGNSILRIDNGKYKGKLKQFTAENLGNIKPGPLGEFCGENGPKVYVAMYVATEQAYNDLNTRIISFINSDERPRVSSCEILSPLQTLYSDLKVPQQNNSNDDVFDKMLDKYYDPRIEDVNTRTGGENVIHGYAGCSLPLVLNHNCPNNSVYLLWAQTEEVEDRPALKALFPRISRHLEGR